MPLHEPNHGGKRFQKNIGHVCDRQLLAIQYRAQHGQNIHYVNGPQLPRYAGRSQEPCFLPHDQGKTPVDQAALRSRRIASSISIF